MRTTTILLLTLLAATALAVEDRTCSVRYVSADHAYLDAGRMDGLTEGATVVIERDGRDVAALTVEFVADHSASCRLDPTGETVLPGDIARFTAPGPPPPVEDEPDVRAPRTRSRADSNRAAAAHRDGPRLSGHVTLQWEHVSDASDAGLDFDQPGLRYDLRLDRLRGGFALRARGSLRHDLRSRAYGYAPEDEWRNRVLEVSLTRLDPDAPWQMAFGRVGVRTAASVGAFDGALVNRAVGGGWRLGAFSGLVPGWTDAGTWTDDRVSGLLAHLVRGDRRNGRLDISVAAAARRRAGEIDRDYLALHGTWTRGGLSLTHAAKLDVNRGWRRDAEGRTISLGDVLLSGRWRLDERWRFSLTLDERDLVRTWTSRSLPDSLFRESGRRGVRAGVVWKSSRLAVRADGGLRRDDRTGGDTKSFGLDVEHRGWPRRDLRIGLSARGFDGPTARGASPALRIRHLGRGGASTRLVAGHRTYELATFDRTSSGNWLSLAHDRDLGRRWSAALETRWDGGDDTAGLRWFLQLRRRL